MQKLVMVCWIFFLITHSGNAQLTRTWKPQIYGGYNVTRLTENTPKSINFDLTYVTKEQWLFNSGYTRAQYISDLNQRGSTPSLLSSKPSVKVHQFNISAGRRFDLLPKWSISTYAGLSFTHCIYPVELVNQTMKYGYYPITFSASYTGAHYAVKNALGMHVNGEVNFLLCENIMLHAGYMYDFNEAHRTGGFTFGGRIGLMKQKYGTRSISKIRI